MAKLAEAPEAIFAVLQRIRDVSLVNFGSLFTPERRLWTLENLQRLHELFVGRFDEGAGGFLEKWRRQLDGASDDIFQLAAELLYAQQFFTSVSGPEKKLENVRAVLDWCSQPSPIPDWAVRGVEFGLAGDHSFNQHRPFHLAWLDEFLIHWQGLPESKRTALLGDAWLFANEVRSVEGSRGAYQPMQEAWLYIVFPDSFENISSRKDKRRIRDAFYAVLPEGPTNNVDADLLKIREHLSPQEGAGFHFYRAPVVDRWKEASIGSNDIEHVRQSRLKERYADFSVDERTAYKRIHEALRRLGQIVIDELGGGRDYKLKLTSGFNPNSGIRGGKPKDLWFGVYRKENEDRFVGNPQLFMIASGRGLEWGFAPLTHPDDFSNQDLKRRTREVAGSILQQLPMPHSSEANELQTALSNSEAWYFRRKQRLDPNQSEFQSLQDWLMFLKSADGARNAGGGIIRYALIDEIDAIDLAEEAKQIASLFRPLMERIIADAPPASAIPPEASTTEIDNEQRNLEPLRNLLQTFLGELISARQGPFQKSAPLWKAISNVKDRLEQFPAVRNRPDLQVNISVGLGKWAAVPWIALLNTKNIKSTQAGVYVVFLIASSLDRLFLTLGQGATNLVEELGQREARNQMVDVASKVRPIISDLSTSGFILDNHIELGSDGWREKNYEIGTIAHIDFAVGDVPDDAKMNDLLESVLAAYERTVDDPSAKHSTFEEPQSGELPAIEPYGVDDALSELFLDQSALERLLAIWISRKNLILQGAPGVGKTYVAKRLAYLLLGEKDAGRIETIQFHQSYSYEDFVQGYRPDGNGGFALRDGIFHRFCEKARLSPGRKHVFIVDEINRGNLSKILGELMLLIEHDKRGPGWAASLTYSQPNEPRFFVPENVHLLGMMNTADRSLSIVDYALRRRFSFISLEPMFGSQQFKRFLVSRGVPEATVDLLVTRMQALNQAIGNDRSNLGPGYRIGHSFFVPPQDFEYDAAWYRRVIETEVYPLLEEYWFDDPDKADSWRERLLQNAP
ncbi:MoxR-like ATPase [Bradyrhizobium japonicum]